MSNSADLIQLHRTKDMVEAILTVDDRARNDDKYLFYKVCEITCKGKGWNINNLSFQFVMNSNNFPTMESVRRSRQKIQAKNPDLCGTKRKEMLQKQIVFKAFATDKDLQNV